MNEDTIPAKAITKPSSKKPVSKKTPASKQVATSAIVAKPETILATTDAIVAKPEAVKPEKKIKKEKKTEDKVKVVRDSFTMPQVDYDLIATIKQRALKSGVSVKKSELLRAGLQALSKLTAAQLKQAVTDLEKIKTGRPKTV